ncbi:RNA-binding protein EWS [Monoraphidium neglectum]|uniref:RNA-binding protein EWS n=1 Tax=Monoraphidium neglectum TaxID=145388 RepID=A0A0D2M5D9_9CHLO|nr:RNA-binding protein EWS [Monoraphidium neglectum]KIY96481.1 RNA-binding protein EWS [Monoraphidium neglectum]|eukprot:XP_013895501.1 RNA-binding protein EWS [Monoraphidium neglectum]
MAYNPETLSFDLPDTDQIYVSGLPSGAGERDLEEYFGSIGVIKTDKKTKGKKIYMYRDKATGALKGDATITYEDPFSASSAVQWFNGKEWKGEAPPHATCTPGLPPPVPRRRCGTLFGRL